MLMQFHNTAFIQLTIIKMMQHQATRCTFEVWSAHSLPGVQSFCCTKLPLLLLLLLLLLSTLLAAYLLLLLPLPTLVLLLPLLPTSMPPLLLLLLLLPAPMLLGKPSLSTSEGCLLRAVQPARKGKREKLQGFRCRVRVELHIF
jgi:hypothetical protein